MEAPSLDRRSRVLASLITLLAAAVTPVSARLAKSPTPPMGWNSYNRYGCSPNESIIELNAQGLVDLGFADLGYDIVTVDCGWPSNVRTPDGKLQWNETLFPAGPEALGEFIHGLGLKFGLYSGAGYLQCGSYDIPASLGYEEIDAQSFAEWGGDTLKYDNCYATSDTNMVDADSAESQSPARFIHMGEALNATDRDIQYFLCQWGIGENVPSWAAPLGNTWRMSNDIFNAWRSIWRIANQAVAHSKGTEPGAYADLDMLIVGLHALSPAEERFHMSLWSMMKSPLMIGGVMDEAQIPADSLTIMSNTEIIAINQDPLGKAASLILRDTEAQWDVWAGELSEGKKVLGVANWLNETQTVSFDLAQIGVGSATAHDVWAGEDVSLSGLESFELQPHELRTLVLRDIETVDEPSSQGYHAAADALLAGSATTVTCADDECLPAGTKVSPVSSGASVTFESVEAPANGKLLVAVDYINYDYDFHEAWEQGTNTRNATIAVNGGPATRWAFPLSGSDWFETGRLHVQLDGFVEGGENEIVFATFKDEEWAPDLVGLEILM